MSLPIAAIVPASQTAVPKFTAAEVAQLQLFLLQHIPLAAAMALRLSVAEQGGALQLQAPLAPNINDKGSAFGGATASLLTLVGWGWLRLANQSLGLQRDIVIAASEFCYQQPVYEPLQCLCRGPDVTDWNRYLQVMRKRDWARLTLRCELRLADASLAATMTGHYATLQGATTP